MRKVMFRNVKELYDGSRQVFKPKITPVIEGGCGIQGPAEAVDHIVKLKMGLSVTEKRFSKQCPSENFHMNKESEADDVCASPCSSFMLSEQLASSAGMKADDKIINEASEGKEHIQCFHGDADMLSPKHNVSNGRHCSSSETSNLLSVCSSLDSFSENEESKDTLRASNILDEAEILVKVDNCQTVTGNDSFSTTKLMFRDDKIFSKQPQKLKELEYFGDNISRLGDSEFVDKMAGDDNGHIDLVDNNQPRSPIKLTNESLEAIAVLSNKSDLSEVSSLRDPCLGASSAKGEFSECSEEQVESSLTRTTTFRIHCQIHNAQKLDIEMNCGEAEAGVANCSDQKEQCEKLVGVNESNTWKSPLQYQPVNYGDGPDHVEDEVQVCDICGDVGREELLATCSKCCDGAEHIYCMSVKLDKVPEGNWICEECMLKDENEKQKQDKFEKEPVRLKGLYTKETRQNLGISGSFSYKNDSKLDIKGLGINKSSTYKSSALHFPAKTLVDRSETTFLMKKEALKTCDSSFKLSKSCCKEVMCPDSSLKNLDGSNMNSTCKGSSLNSKSFGAMKSEVKSQTLGSGVEKRNFARETATSGNLKERVTRKLCKSTSFNNVCSDHVNADLKIREFSSSFSHVEDLERLRHEKKQISVLVENRSKLHNPLMRSTVADKCAATLVMNKKVPPHGETGLSLLSRSQTGNGKLSYLSKSTCDLTCGGFPSEEQNNFANDTRQDVENVSKVTIATKTNNSTAKFPSCKPTYLEGSPSFASLVDNPSWISAVPQLDYIWRGGFEIQRNGRFLNSFNGIQAHLSTCASPRVLEVAHRFPQKILLEQQPRMNIWPIQFLEGQPKEDNIALYFFAKDLESYERNYESLLACMIKNDVGLKGNFNGVELLIFSSNLLPENCQRWNRLLFLWGVFRGRRINCSQDMPSPQKTISSSLNLAASGSQTLNSSARSSGISSSSDLSCSGQQTLISPVLQPVPTLSPGRMVETRENQVSSTQEKVPGLQSPDGRTSVVGTPIENDQCFGEVLHNNFSEREEKESRGKGIDLNRECEIYGVRIDEERECKRMKGFSGVFECNNSSNLNYLNNQFPFEANDLGPSKDKRFGRAYQSSIFSADAGSVDTMMGIKARQWQVVSMNGGNWLETGIPNLELSLGTEKRLAEQGIMPLFPESMNYKKKEGHSNAVTSNECDESSTSLSLSLALPVPMEEQSLKQDSEK